jgi:predicted dithiol-disulfide oxidoreductase (DUF899 family)
MSSSRLPFVPLDARATPAVVDRATWAAACQELLVREKANLRESDALAAARRRLPMTPVPRDVQVVGAEGPVPLLEAFEGRRQLVGYFHMWHPGRSWDQQCEGCTFFTAQVQRPEYLHSRDVTLAIFCEGSYAESRPYADFVQNRLPWWSAEGADGLVAGRDFGFLACYLRDGDDVYETWWSTGRGTEAMSWSYDLLDRTVYGRQESWEDSPEGWPQPFGVEASQFRTAGRPTIQWSVTDEPVVESVPHCH